MTAEVSGAVIERVVLDALFHGTVHLSDPVESVMSPSLPMVGAGESVAAAMAALTDADALIVVEDGKPTGVITRQDVLAFLAT
jgi:cystathionine beta-synthase